MYWRLFSSQVLALRGTVVRFLRPFMYPCGLTKHKEPDKWRARLLVGFTERSISIQCVIVFVPHVLVFFSYRHEHVNEA